MFGPSFLYEDSLTNTLRQVSLVFDGRIIYDRLIQLPDAG